VRIGERVSVRCNAVAWDEDSNRTAIKCDAFKSITTLSVCRSKLDSSQSKGHASEVLSCQHTSEIANHDAHTHYDARPIYLRLAITDLAAAAFKNQPSIHCKCCVSPRKQPAYRPRLTCVSPSDILEASLTWAVLDILRMRYKQWVKKIAIYIVAIGTTEQVFCKRLQTFLMGRTPHFYAGAYSLCNRIGAI